MLAPQADLFLDATSTKCAFILNTPLLARAVNRVGNQCPSHYQLGQLAGLNTYDSAPKLRHLWKDNLFILALIFSIIPSFKHGCTAASNNAGGNGLVNLLGQCISVTY